MKLFLSAFAVLLSAICLSPMPAARAAVALQLGPPSGLYAQEYWIGDTPRYWLGNAGTGPINVRVVALAKLAGKMQVPTIISEQGPFTIAAGGAIDIDGAAFLRAGSIEFRTPDDSVLGALPPPSTPVGAAQTRGGIRLWAGLNGSQRPRKDVWVTAANVPTAGDKQGTVTVSLNGAQPGFITVKDSHIKGLPSVKILAVTSPTQPVQRSKDAWFVDVRTPKALLQTIDVKYEVPASTSPTLLLLDISLVDEKRLLVPLPRAVYVSAPIVAPKKHVPAPPRPSNRPVRGR